MPGNRDPTLGIVNTPPALPGIVIGTPALSQVKVGGGKLLAAHVIVMELPKNATASVSGVVMAGGTTEDGRDEIKRLITN